MDWMEFGRIYGLPMLILAAIGLFGAKSLWPFIKEQVDAAQNEGRKEREAFLAALERRDQEFGKMVAEMKELTTAVNGLRNEVAIMARSNEDTKRRPAKL